MGCTLTAKYDGTKGVKSSIRVAYGKIVVFHLPSHGIALISLLDVRKATKRSTAGSKKVSIFKFAVEVLTNKVIIRHSSSSKVVKRVWMLALTLASPSAFPIILHSKGRITYLPSFREILGSHTTLLIWTSPLIAIALEEGANIVYPSLWRRQDILLCLNTVRRVECHLSQESSPTWLAALGRNIRTPINRNK